MNDDARRHLNTFQAISKFGVDNAPDFPGGSPGGVQFALMADIVDQFQASGAGQMGAIGESSQDADVKSIRREEMRL